jgi:DNA-binding winged helix-turn-helix (wHTH) protein/tetratricopeptide (TPR) repeat protein
MIYAFGGCQLDTRRYELRRDGALVPIEPQVFDVLAYLAEHDDRLVPKEELFDAVWGTRFVTESALTTRIKSARRAVGDDGRSQRVIRTVHGRGYRLATEVSVIPDVGHGPRTDGPTPVSPVSAAPPELAGRAEELLRLQGALLFARQGARRTVLVSGEAGIGKSTLVDAFSTVARRSGARVTLGQCVPLHGAREPYLPLLDALGQLAAEESDGAVTSVLVDRAPSWVVQLPWLVDEATLERARMRILGGTRERMLREIVEALDLLASDRPLVFVVEDLQWSDPSTLDVVASVARRRRPARLLVVLTERSGDRPADGDRLAAVRAELRLHHAVDELALDPLGSADLAAVVTPRLGHIGENLAALVHARSGGNPLHALALVDDWTSRGLLHQHATGVGTELMHLIAAGVPATLRELIEQRLVQLDEADVFILEAAAVAGMRAGAATAAAALERDAEEVEGRLTTLARRGVLLRPDGEQDAGGALTSVFAFRHTLYREVLYNRVPAGRKAHLHRRVGEELERAYGQRAGEHAAELALHFTRAGAPLKAIPHLLAAAAQASSRDAHVEARDHLDAALDLIPRLAAGPDRDRLELEVRGARGPVLIAMSGWAAPEVQDTYSRAVQLCRSLGEPGRLPTLLCGLATVHEYRGEYRQSQRLMEENIDFAPVDTGTELVSHELLACSNYHQGAFRRAVEHAEAGIKLYDPGAHLTLMASYGENPGVACRTWGALARWYLGEADQAAVLMQAALALARDVDHRFSLAHAHEQAAVLQQLRGDPEGVEQHAQQALDLAREQGFAYRVATGSILLGWSLALRGDLEGLDILTEGIDAYRRTGARMDLAYFLALHADALRAAGCPHEALDLLEEAVRVRDPRGYSFDAELHRLRAEVAHDLGDRATAAREFGLAEQAARGQEARALGERLAETAGRLVGPAGGQ